MSQNPFEIPQQMRDIAERNIEQTRAAYDQFMDSMAAWSRSLPANGMTFGFRAVQEQATKFAKHNADAGFSLANDLVNAKDFQEVLALQSRFAQTQMQIYASQAQVLGRLMTEAAQGMRPRS